MKDWQQILQQSKEAIFYKGKAPFELVVVTIALRLKKLPSEVLEEDLDWLLYLHSCIIMLDEYENKQIKKAKNGN